MTMTVDREAMLEKVGEASGLLKGLANRNRLMIVCALAEAERSVAWLESELGIRQPTLSQQLTALRAANIVKARREARSVHYSLTDARAGRLVEALYDIFCAGAAAAPPARPDRKETSS